jgi:glycolate oxidase iron-sulfur subunit
MTFSPQQLEDAVRSCMKCGFCHASCPVFIGEETTSPRAKVRLARALANGEIGLTEGVKKQASRCLNCLSCAVECPSGVEPNKIALAVRSAYVERDGLSVAKRLAFRGLLTHPRLAAVVSRLAGLGQHVLALDLQNNPLRLLLPAVGVRADKDLPSFGRKSLMARVGVESEPFGDEKARVLYFPGCAVNLLYPEVGLATVSVLRKLGARVTLPRELVCCSTPVFSSGDIASARELARRNLDVFEQVKPDFIVTSCGSCGLTIKKEWREVLGLDGPSVEVLDVSEFVARFARDGEMRGIEQDSVVTYHDSCHLRRGMGVHVEPRQLLKAALGDAFVEMRDADRCCGGGGTFSLDQPELSQTVAETKMAAVADSGAEVIVTGCPGCMMQLRDSAVHRRMQVRVRHTVQIIDRALSSGE